MKSTASTFPLRALIVLTLLTVVSMSLTAHAEHSNQDETAQTYSIELHNQIPELLAPALRPMLTAQESLTHYHNTLLLTTTPNRYEELLPLIEQLDTPSQNLLISVRSNSSSNSERDSRGFSGGIKKGRVILHTGEKRQHSEGARVSHDGLSYSVNQQSTYTTGSSDQHVRALEGAPAYIYTGQTAALQSHDYWGRHNTQLVDALQGFYVTARIIGNRVHIDVSVSDDHIQESGQHHTPFTIDTESIVTSVSGPIGEWISLGNLSTNGHRQDQNLAKNATTYRHSLSDYSIRVMPSN